MKVLHVITGLNNGGAEGVLYRLCRTDTADQHVVVSLIGEGTYSRPLREIGVRVYALDLKQRFWDPSQIWKLGALVHKERPDVVQTWMYHADLLGGLAARLQGIPVVWGIRSTDFGRGWGKQVILKTCASLSAAIPEKIVSCAHTAKKTHVEKGYSEFKIVVIPNGYDTNSWHPISHVRETFRKNVLGERDAFIMGMVARQDESKNHEVLLLALRSLLEAGRDFVFLLVGKGNTPENHFLMDLIHMHQLQPVVHLLGERRDIPAIMNALDLHVLSSKSEGFPNVVAEAMACAVPCVVTDVGDAARIVGDTGWVVPPGNPERLADAIASAMEERQRDPQAWERRRQAARSRIVENFSLEAMVERFRAVWNEAVREFQERRRR